MDRKQAEKLLRRFLAFVWALVRHGTALLVAFLGSVLLSVPGRIEPLLSPEHARKLDSLLTVSPHQYRLIAGAFFIVAFFYASFRAWNEERDEIERLSGEINKPGEVKLRGMALDQGSSLFERHSRDRHTQAMQHLASEMAEQRAVKDGGYSSGKVASLSRLFGDGTELSNEHISVNSPHPRIQRDDWISKHERWREKVLAILNDKDTTIFQALVTAGDQTKGHAGGAAIDQLHGDKRGQLFAELDRLKRILDRHV